MNVIQISYVLIGVSFEQAIIVSCCGCFHGRTLAVISMSCDNDATCGFGPLLPGHLKVDFGDADALEKIFMGQYISSSMLCLIMNVVVGAILLLQCSGSVVACF